MTTSAARALALLEILQTGGIRTVATLADRLDVDERTVRRSIRQLVDLGIPVDSIRGRYGGYRLAPGYKMPPLTFTDDEALAVMLGLVAGRRSGLIGRYLAASESAAAKLTRVLPSTVSQKFDALLQTATVTAAPSTLPGPNATTLLTIAEAAHQGNPVALSYADRSGRASDRTLLPYGLVAHSGRWYVTGADSASGENRTFRVDRITAVSMQSGSFDVPSGLDVASAVVSGLENAPRTHQISLRIKGSVEHIRAHLPAGIATVDIVPGSDDSWVHVTLGAERLDWVPPVLAAIDRPFVIEHPEELRDLLRQLAGRLIDCASAEPERSG